MTPTEYNELVDDRRRNRQPVPPAKFFRQAGHHWLVHRLPDNGPQNVMIAQWSPSQQLWFHSNELATTAKPIGYDGKLTHWEWVSEIPIPEIPSLCL